jgi:hypothetical protein
MISPEWDVEENGEGRPAMLPAQPELSAYNDHEAGRLERIAATWGSACTAVRLLSYRYQRFWDGAVLALRDHKGTLTVTWRDKDSRSMFEGIVMGAWEHQGEHNGEHTLGRRNP